MWMAGSPLVQRVRDSGSSFAWAIRLAPATTREGLAAFYLFCRSLDDLADTPGLPLAQRQEALARWHGAILGEEAWPDPAVGTVLDRAALPRACLEEIFAGVCMDLPPGLVAPDTETLKTYCRRVAGEVGRGIIHLLGAEGEAVEQFALVSGEAIQLVNILRDVVEDAGAGRLYLPAPLLRDHGIPPAEQTPQGVLTHPALPAVCAALAVQAQDRHAEARHLLTALPQATRRRLGPAVTMLATYDVLLQRLQRRGWDRSILGTAPPLPRLYLIALALKGRLWGGE